MECTFRDLQKMCEREMRYRTHVYPRLIEKGTMSSEKAATENYLMEAAMRHFKELADAEDAKGRFL